MHLVRLSRTIRDGKNRKGYDVTGRNEKAGKERNREEK